MKQAGHPLPLMGQQVNPFGQQSQNQQQQQQQQNQNSNQMPQIWSNPPPPQAAPQQQQQQQAPPQQPVISAQIAAQIETISTQQIALREQIRQSELNLTAQHGVTEMSDCLRSRTNEWVFVLGPFAAATSANR